MLMKKLNAENLQVELQDFIEKANEGFQYNGLIKPIIEDLKQRLVKYIE